MPVTAAVDWGTTSFRAWLLDGEGGAIAESRSDEGLLKAGEKGYEAILEDHLGRLGAARDLPAIVCGMAGSRQGWVEAPYISCPARLADLHLNAVTIPGAARPIRILPGIAQRDSGDPDVMRGEETQLLGIGSRLGRARHLVCMPGTHCKWVVTDGQTVERFATWTTGELFSLMSTASILRHSIDPSAAKVSSGDPVFGQWVRRGLEEPEAVSRLFFTIRAATLLGQLKNAEVPAALSGLLIGSEISSGLGWAGESSLPVVLVATGILGRLYAGALAMAGIKPASEDADEAVRAGLFSAHRFDESPSGRNETP